VKIEVAPYKGWARALHISNGDVELVVTLQVGPRILRYAHIGGPNLLKEIPEQMGTGGEDKWVMRGGHRLWASPEDPAYTYYADNQPTEHGIEGNQAWIRSAMDPRSGLSYEMRITLQPTGSGVRVEHVVANQGGKTFNLAPWALTVFATGGTAIIPLPAFAPHPGDDATHAADFAPQMTLALWPYFRFSDIRFAFGDHSIRVKQDPNASGPTKIGAALPTGWVAYHLNETLFVKRFTFDPKAIYPDGGCNFETYTDADVLELETLAGLRNVQPGQSASHIETWSLHRDINLPGDEAATNKLVAPLVAQTLQP